VLSQVPALWDELVAKWTIMTPPPDEPTALFLLQNVFGIWPRNGAVTDQLRTRLHAYAEKAMREAAVRTSWHRPDEEFEAAVHGWLDAVVDGPVGIELTGLVAQLGTHIDNDVIAQKLLSLTVPGIPDVYQGTELFDDSLVDPDNRRPVDYDARRQALKALTDPMALPPRTPSRSCAARTYWWRSPAGPCGSPKPVGVTRRCSCLPASGPIGSPGVDSRTA